MKLADYLLKCGCSATLHKEDNYKLIIEGVRGRDQRDVREFARLEDLEKQEKLHYEYHKVF